jgi:predicted DNA-binding transcriptional regulator YafY
MVCFHLKGGGVFLPKTTEEKVRSNRLLTIDNAIREGNYPSLAKLAKLTVMNPRTIARDIEYLRDMYKAPLEYSKAHHGYFYSEPNFFIKSITLTEGELFSLALFDQMLQQYRNTPIEENLWVIFRKIAQAMPEKVTFDASFLDSQVSIISDHSGKIDPDVFQSIFTALKTHETISFEYRSLEKITHTKREADPYHAICQRGSWHLLAFCHEHKEPRMFAFSRFKKVSLTTKKFIIPTDFKPEAYFDKDIGVYASARTPYTVELLFSKEVGTYAFGRYWHKTQAVKQQKDGSVYVKFTTTQIPLVLSEVMAQGHTVKVLQPQILIDMVKQEAKKIIKAYKK